MAELSARAERAHHLPLALWEEDARKRNNKLECVHQLAELLSSAPKAQSGGDGKKSEV